MRLILLLGKRQLVDESVGVLNWTLMWHTSGRHMLSHLVTLVSSRGSSCCVHIRNHTNCCVIVNFKFSSRTSVWCDLSLSSHGDHIYCLCCFRPTLLLTICWTFQTSQYTITRWIPNVFLWSINSITKFIHHCMKSCLFKFWFYMVSNLRHFLESYS